MKNKKGGMGTLVGVVIGLGFIVLMIVILIALSGKSNDNTPMVGTNYSMKLYAMALNIETEEQVQSNYRLEYNGTIISSGILDSEALTETIVPKKPVDLICWSDKYYLGITRKTFSPEELLSNISKIECGLYEIGNINVKHEGEIKNGESIIKLNISTDKNLENIKICNSWTAGIISALPMNKNIICNSGIWTNLSTDLTHLPDLFYRCGNCVGKYCDWVEKCEEVNGAICSPYLYNTPNRYERKVDNCYNTGVTLNGGSVVINYIVKANQPIPMDEITFYIMDSDIRLDITNGIQRHLTELNEGQIGTEDLIYKVKYGV